MAKGKQIFFLPPLLRKKKKNSVFCIIKKILVGFLENSGCYYTLNVKMAISKQMLYGYF